MNSLSESEYNKNFSWFHGDQYTRRSSIDHFAPDHKKIPYRQTWLDNNESSLLNHKEVAKQYLKLNPALDRTGLRNEKDYELSLSTYRDSFRKNGKYPSVEDYVLIAEHVADNCFPESVKCYYEPDEEENRFTRDGPKLLKYFDVRIREPTNKKVRLESMAEKKIPSEIEECNCKISPECIPKYAQTDEEFVEEVIRKTKKFFEGYSDKEKDKFIKSQIRYIDFLQF